MRRREFFGLVGGAAVAWPFAARAQQAGKVVRIGVLGPSLDDKPALFNEQSNRSYEPGLPKHWYVVEDVQTKHQIEPSSSFPRDHCPLKLNIRQVCTLSPCRIDSGPNGIYAD
jgi:hypothetical protein